MKMMLGFKRFIYRRIELNDSRPTPLFSRAERAASKLRRSTLLENEVIEASRCNSLLCCAVIFKSYVQ